jgi:hypothetical protein
MEFCPRVLSLVFRVAFPSTQEYFKNSQVREKFLLLLKEFDFVIVTSRPTLKFLEPGAPHCIGVQKIFPFKENTSRTNVKIFLNLELKSPF